MSVLVYAITIDDARASAASELHEICAAGLRALAEPVEASPPPDLEQLVRYEETVETTMQSHTILPMRFGSVLDSAEDVRDLLRTRASEFLAALEHLSGATEYGVRIAAAPEPAPVSVDLTQTGPGESYMRTRLSGRRRSQELCAWLDGELDGLVRDRSYRSAPDPATPLSAAFLVDGVSEHEFRERVAKLSDGTDHILWWSGPWPPYSFAAGVHT
jgi:hypothetical protein